MTRPTELQVGMRVRDNESADERIGEVLAVVGVLGSVVHYARIRVPSNTILPIPCRHIHLDGKPRKTGWSRL